MLVVPDHLPLKKEALPMFEISPALSSSTLADARKAMHTLDAALTAYDAGVKAERAAKEAAKKQKDPFDALEEKLMQATAIVAAASGTPDQAKDMLAKARAKALRAAADGADTGALEAMVRQMEHLAKVAEEHRRVKNAPPGYKPDTNVGVVPTLTALAAS